MSLKIKQHFLLVLIAIKMTAGDKLVTQFVHNINGWMDKNEQTDGWTDNV